jgi:hypothetical protein
LQHVLPKGFVKIRYYGFFSSGNRHRLRRARQLIGAQETNEPEEPSQEVALNSEVACRCPQCGQVSARSARGRSRPRLRETGHHIQDKPTVAFGRVVGPPRQ